MNTTVKCEETVMLPRPDFSIVMPTFNSGRYVEESVQSVLAQTLKNWELLITDDGSSDNTRQLLEGLAKNDSRIKLVFNAVNCGASAVRNEAMGRAKGEYVAFLDSDDLWLPNKLAEQKKFMDKGLDFSFAPYEIVNESGQTTGKKIDCGAPSRVGYLDMLKKRATMGCLTVAIRRSALANHKMPCIRQGQDYALWLRVLKSVPFAARMDVVLAHYRNVPGSISSNKFRKAVRQWQIYRNIEKIPLGQTMWYFANYVKNAFFRR